MIKMLWISIAIYIVQILTTCQTSIVVTVTDTKFYGDPEYWSDESKVYLVNKDIKNEIFSSLALIKTLPNSSRAHIEALQEVDGKYETMSEIDQWMPMCDLIDEPIFLGSLFRGMGFKGCPVEPAVYSNPSFVPPTIENSDYPQGNYFAKLQLEAEDKTLISSIETKFKIE